MKTMLVGVYAILLCLFSFNEATRLWWKNDAWLAGIEMEFTYLDASSVKQTEKITSGEYTWVAPTGASKITVTGRYNAGGGSMITIGSGTNAELRDVEYKSTWNIDIHIKGSVVNHWFEAKNGDSGKSLWYLRNGAGKTYLRGGYETVDTFSIITHSGEVPNVNGAASNLLPTINPEMKTSPFWNAAGSGPYTITFDFGSSKRVVDFQLKSFGDYTHDTENFDLSYSSSSSGPFELAQAFIAAGSTSSLQIFSLTRPVTSRYWKLTISSTYSIYQPCISYVNFVSVSKPYLLDDFSIVAFSAEYPPQPATNLLPVNNPSASPLLFWNAVNPTYPNPNWIRFDLRSDVTVQAVLMKSTGDTTHDASSIWIEYGSTPTSFPFDQTFLATGGISTMQTFTLSPRTYRYWQLSIKSTFSNYQACVAYINFMVADQWQ